MADDSQDTYQLSRVRQLIAEGITAGWHLGMQVYVSQAGRVLVDAAFGENAPGIPLQTDTLMLWMSSGKPLTAAAIMRLQDLGKLSLDAPITSFIPEFAAAGKAAITIKHLLTHTAGLKPTNSGWRQLSWDQIIENIAESALLPDWRAGERGAYDPGRSWFILGEIIRRTSGLAVEHFVREQFLEPLEMLDTWMTLPNRLHAAYEDRIGITYGQLDGALSPTSSHTAAACQVPSPGSSVRGPAANLGRFYEMLLRKGTTEQGRRLLSEEGVTQMTQRVRSGIRDETFRHVVDFGLGLIINSNEYGPDTVPYGFGRYASRESFGHGGAQSSIGFADPGRQLVVVMIANGCPGELIHNRRFRALANAIYEDLGLTD